MRTYLPILFCLFLFAHSWGQPVSLSGLPAPTVWCQVQYEPQKSQFHWRDTKSVAALTPFSVDAASLLNFWPIPVNLPLSAGASIRVPETVRDRATIFVVYKPATQAKESVLWALESPSKAPLVCTDKRIADLASLSYINWEDQGSQWRIATWYQAGKPATATTGWAWLQIGKAPIGQSLPVAETPGVLAELMLFPNVLSPIQRLQVESYLALKYSITLGSAQQPKNYTSSKQQIIWDGTAMQKWHHRIFGIGKDTGNQWEQQCSQSVLAPDFLMLSVSGVPTLNGMPGEVLPNFCYWITGDNDQPLEWIDRGPHQQLKRSWIVQTTGSTQGILIDLRLDLGKWLSSGQTVQDYHLLIDRSGKGNFLAPETEVIAPSSFSKGSFAHYPGISWDKDGSGTDVYTFIRTTQAVEHDLSTALRLYPNPVSAGQVWQWQLRIPQPSTLELHIRNTAGQLVRTVSFAPADYFTGDEPPLPAGLYSLEFHCANQVYTQKLVVQ